MNKAKYEKYDGLFEMMETKEGENEVYKLAKIIERKRDFHKVWCIKDEDNRVLTNRKEIVNR